MDGDSLNIDLDTLADKVAARLKPVDDAGSYKLLAFSLVGSQLSATIQSPSGETYQGTVGAWERVKVVEVSK